MTHSLPFKPRQQTARRRPAPPDLSPEFRALLDHIAEELAIEYLRLLRPEDGKPADSVSGSKSGGTR